MKYSINEIKNEVRNLFPNAQFHLTEDGDLTMSLKGEFVDHEWKKGTFTL